MAAISYQHGVDHIMSTPNSLNKEKFCGFLDQLKRKYPNRKIALFGDQLGVHTCNYT